MKNVFIFLFILYGIMAEVPKNYQPIKEVEKNGVKIQWKLNGDQLDFEMSAPTDGWVAIGLNPQKGLPGTNLIMGNIIDGKVSVSDRYIIGVGQHEAVEKLGGQSHLSNISGQEKNRFTSIRFSIKNNALDEFHYDLIEEASFQLLIAYSVEDDFSHHSVMRTSVNINL